MQLEKLGREEKKMAGFVLPARLTNIIHSHVAVKLPDEIYEEHKEQPVLFGIVTPSCRCDTNNKLV